MLVAPDEGVVAGTLAGCPLVEDLHLELPIYLGAPRKGTDLIACEADDLDDLEEACLNEQPQREVVAQDTLGIACALERRILGSV